MSKEPPEKDNPPPKNEGDKKLISGFSIRNKKKYISREGKKYRHWHVVKDEGPQVRDWTVPYSGVEESGRGVLEYDKEITNIVIRYFKYDAPRFEQIRHFAEVSIKGNDKFIIDGIDEEELAQHITDIAWDVIQCRKKMKLANSNLKVV